MTPEHREQFLATEGWQQTERGHVRGEWFWNSTGTGSIWVTNPTKPSVKFRRFPFGRQPKYDVMVGWFATHAKIRRGTRTAILIGGREIEVDNWDDSDPRGTPRPELREIAYGWLYTARNKRQGWDKNGEVMG